MIFKKIICPKFDVTSFTIEIKRNKNLKLVVYSYLLDINIPGPDGALPIHYAAKYFKKDKHVALSMSAPVEETGNVEKAILEVGTVASGFSKPFFDCRTILKF